MSMPRKIYLGLAALTTGLVALQFLLAGIGIFGAGGFGAHRFVGFVLLHATTLLMLIVAAVGRLGRTPMIFCPEPETRRRSWPRSTRWSRS
jgi:hypothetical protein